MTDSPPFLPTDFHAGLLDAVDDAVFVHHPADGRILYVNRAACELCGWPAGEMLALKVADLSEGVPPYTQAEAAAWVRKARLEGPQRFEWRARARDGRVFWVEVCLRRAEVRGADLVVASVRDVDEAKRVREELALARERMNAAFEHAPVGMSIATPEGVFLRVNPALCRMLGRSREELEGSTFHRYTHPEDRGVSRECLERLVAGEVPFYSLRKRYVRPDGTDAWVETHASLVRDAEGRPLHVLCQMVDLSLQRAAEVEREKLQHRLRRSQLLEAMGRLAAGVAHEFNNILGSILGAAYVGRLDLPATSPAREEFDRIAGLCKRGGEITQRLLAVARREAGPPGAASAGECLEEIRVLLEHTLPKTIALRLEVEPGLAPVAADAAGLTSVLLNLCLNARDAMPRGGTLQIRAARSDRDGARGVAIEVQDTGAGVAPEIRDQIFEPFFTTKSEGHGAGLGLAEAHASVSAWGGDLDLAATGPGGSTFRVWLPEASGTPEEPAAAPPRQEPGHPLTAAPVLVVEDEEGVGDLVEVVLSRSGYRVERTRTGLEALERLRQREPPGLLVLDLILPEFDGIRLYRVVRGLLPELPVVVITGREDLAAKAVPPGCPVLPKPFGGDEFLRAVEEALRPAEPARGVGP
ncbi:hybrid sensor histidine kinase/response regulator [Deferrisoma sp.]